MKKKDCARCWCHEMAHAGVVDWHLLVVLMVRVCEATRSVRVKLPHGFRIAVGCIVRRSDRGCARLCDLSGFTGPLFCYS